VGGLGPDPERSPGAGGTLSRNKNAGSNATDLSQSAHARGTAPRQGVDPLRREGRGLRPRFFGGRKGALRRWAQRRDPRLGALTEIS